LDISIIIVNWNTRELLLDCLASVFQTVKGITFEVWLVDNASTDGSVDAAITEYPDINIIRNQKNLGFATANNRAFTKMKGRYALMLNTDIILTDGAVKELYDFMESNPETGIACGQLLNTDGSRQNSIANFPSLLSLLTNETLLRILLPNKFPSKRKNYSSPIEVDSCIGACMIARGESLREVRYFDERYFFFLEETDLARKMKQVGRKAFFVPSAKIFHAQGKTVGSSANARIMFYRSRYQFLKKWYPHSYGIFYPVVFLRLIVNTVSSLLALLFSFGLNAKIKNKFFIYLQLIFWHLRGCP
jgi:GT2 family glycosyltransferase